MDRQSKKECNQCGICQELCMVFKSRKASIVSELNENSQVGAWNCVNCWKCIEVCPQGVDIYSFMTERRRKEDIPEIIRHSINNIINTGCSMNLQGMNEVREMYGLKPLRLIREQRLKTLLECELQ